MVHMLCILIESLRRGHTAMNSGAITGYQLVEAHFKNEIYEKRNAPNAMQWVSITSLHILALVDII